MSSLSYLNSALSMYRQNLKKAEDELKIQKKRLSDIKNILSVLNRSFDDYASDISGYARRTSDKILAGIKGSRNMSQSSRDVSNEQEPDPNSDSKLSSAKASLMGEKSVVENKIAELEAQIVSLKNHISETEEAIREEERRLEEERREAERREEERREEARSLAASRASSR